MHRRRLPARRPSEVRGGGVPGVTLFSVDGGRAADFGAEVHAALATVEWWDPAAGEAWAAARREEGMPERVVTEALGCLGAPALADVFRRPAGAAEVWRERAFEIVLDDTWVTGVFDRVVVERAVAGEAVRVRVIDFKTDRLAGGCDFGPVVKRHAGQLDLYRRVAAVLTGVRPGQVTCALMLTESRRILPVPFTS
jgi:ATP-dependent helicase/nuclease subunit A